MTETELLAIVATNNWTLQRIEIEDTNPALMRKAILCWKPVSNVVTQQWFHYFVKADGTAYWERSDPFPAMVTTFQDQLNAKITALVVAGIIKAAYVEKIDQINNTAIVVAVMGATLAYKTYHVYKDTGGNLQITEVTGAYPIG